MPAASRPLRLPCLALLVLLASSFPSAAPARADSGVIEAKSRVTAVTLFTDRALVTREAKVHVPPGAQTVSLSSMPPGIDENSLRVQGKADAAVKIGAVEIRHVFQNDPANAAEREKLAALEARVDEKTLAEGEIKALETREDFINRVVAGGADKHDNALSKLDFAPDKWAQAWALVQSGMADTQKELAAKRIGLRKLDADIARLQEELNQIRSAGTKERRDARINVEASQDTDLILTVSYQTGGAWWRPVYDARLDTGKADVSLEQYGQAAQQTGEDWTDIDLSFSTARPATGADMPRLSEWWLRIFAPVLMRGRAESVMAAAPTMMPAPENKAKGVVMSMAERDATQMVDAAQPNAMAQTTEYAAEFHAPGRATLRSSRDATKLFIGSVKMKAELTAQLSPRLMPTAFLFAKVTNGEDYPLIPGAVAKFRDDAFIGNGAMPLLRPGETETLSFGADDRIKVEYKQVHEEQTNPLLVVVGDVKVERHYRATVQNLHKDPIGITVFEQYPVAGSPDIKVDLLDNVTTPGYAKDPEGRQGVIAWTETFAPKQEKGFTLGFRAKYPKDKQVEGL